MTYIASHNDIQARLRKLRSRTDQLAGERDRVQSDRDEAQRQIARLEREQARIARAQDIVRAVALGTQQQLQYHIASVVTRALEAVFDDPYSVELIFEQRRGRTECDIWFVRDGDYIAPLSAGLGAVDVAAFALRVASWSLARQRTRNVLLLDEAFRHVKGREANRRAIQMVHEVAKESGLQIIMISDERAPREDIRSGADRLFEVSKDDKGQSHVSTVDDAQK